MTPLQNLYLTIFNFSPAIILAVFKQWWVGVAALVVTFALSWILTFTVTMKLSSDSMMLWAWLKPPIVAAVILSFGWWLF